MNSLQRLAARAALVSTRLSLSMWVGAAVLFVITSIAEQTFSGFDSRTRDQLASVRFPLYYQFCAICLTAGLVSSGVGMVLASRNSRTGLLATFAFTLASAGVARFDYVEVYQPLQAMISPPGKARTQEFERLHRRSTLMNEIHLSLALAAAVVSCCTHPESARGSVRDSSAVSL